MSVDKTVLVFLDDEERYVPSFVEDEDTARIALRVKSGKNVAYAHSPNDPISFESGHFFENNEHYVTCEPTKQNHDAEPYESWQTDPDAWKDNAE